jgi:hypothetical protein
VSIETDEQLVQAIRDTLISDIVVASDGEGAANVVDVVDFVARAIHRGSTAHAAATVEAACKVENGLSAIAAALTDLAAALRERG